MPSVLQDVTPASLSLQPYAAVAADDTRTLQALAGPLAGTTIWHINSAAQGGGVAELLRSQVALERGLGLDSRWLVIQPTTPRFFSVTRKIHNGLQSDDTSLTPEEWALYAAESQLFTAALAKLLTEHPADIIMAHDPQPLAAVSELSTAAAKVLRIHPDICQPSNWVQEWLCRQAPHFQRVIVSRADCQPACLLAASTAIAPAIDPFSEKNLPLAPSACRSIFTAHGIDADRPLVTQVSRFDIWKDQLGVLAAYQQAKPKIPGLQLALAGFITAEDDPDATAYAQNVARLAAGDPDVHLFSQLSQLRNVSQNTFINALQTASTIIIQKSLREGFGLTVTEAMLKGTPVIASATGGITLQIQSGRNGLLVNSVTETAAALIQLINDPPARRRLGQAGQVSARQNFLLPHYLAQHFQLYANLRAHT